LLVCTSQHIYVPVIRTAKKSRYVVPRLSLALAHDPIRFHNEKGSNTFKSGHPPVPRRTRLFLPEGSAARYPTFSSWQAAWFVSVPVSPLRRAVHRRSSRPAQVFPKSTRDPSLLGPLMSGTFGRDASWGSRVLFAVCEVGLGARRPAKGSPRAPPSSVTRECCQARSTTGRQPWFPEERSRLASPCGG
jgi:hypothetical protein